MTPETVIVQLRTGKAFTFGSMTVFCILTLLGFGILVAAAGRLDGQTIFIGGSILLLLAICAAYYFGLAIRKPVALRMDANGISGYYAEPAVWSEIMEIATFETSKGARYLGFAFLNPETIRNRQSAWRKFSNWARNPFQNKSRNAHYHYQIVISQELLLERDVESLATIARAFHRAA